MFETLFLSYGGEKWKVDPSQTLPLLLRSSAGYLVHVAMKVNRIHIPMSAPNYLHVDVTPTRACAPGCWTRLGYAIASTCRLWVASSDTSYVLEMWQARASCSHDILSNAKDCIVVTVTNLHLSVNVVVVNGFVMMTVH